MIVALTDVLQGVERKVARIKSEVSAYRDLGRRLFVTSSFQTQSIPLLHILAEAVPGIPVIFLNTGYLFPETLTFLDFVAKRLALEVVNLRPNVPKSEQRNGEGRLLFVTDSDKCCYLNKVEPLEPYLREYDVWISGVRADQSSTRKGFSREQPGPHGTIRYHPILDWSAREIFAYRKRHDLPEHPLDRLGYSSIGCMPCTVSLSNGGGDDRDGRWTGSLKTECGLHTELGGPVKR